MWIVCVLGGGVALLGQALLQEVWRNSAWGLLPRWLFRTNKQTVHSEKMV